MTGFALEVVRFIVVEETRIAGTIRLLDGIRVHSTNIAFAVV